MILVLSTNICGASSLLDLVHTSASLTKVGQPIDYGQIKRLDSTAKEN